MSEKKVYLETPEKVIEVLKSGKKVFSDDGWTYTMFDGCVMARKEDKIFINPSVYMAERPYIYEATPIKLEVGKFYRTGEGKKAFCFYKKNITDGFNCLCILEGQEGVCVYRQDGTCGFGDLSDEKDIIAEWE